MLATTVHVFHGGEAVARGSPLEVFRQRELLAQSNLRPPDLFLLAEQLQRAGLDIEPDLDAGRMAARILAAVGIRQREAGTN